MRRSFQRLTFVVCFGGCGQSGGDHSARRRPLARRRRLDLRGTTNHGAATTTTRRIIMIFRMLLSRFVSPDSVSVFAFSDHGRTRNYRKRRAKVCPKDRLLHHSSRQYQRFDTRFFCFVLFSITRRHRINNVNMTQRTLFSAVVGETTSCDSSVTSIAFRVSLFIFFVRFSFPRLI